MNETTNFYNLDPNVILGTAEKNGFATTGELIQLNSYENRVFEIKLENRNSLIAKYYRPGRWSQATILDEHKFTHELLKESIEVAAPIELKNKSTLDVVDGINYAFFEKVRGRMVQELTPENFKKLGRWLARLHNVGALNEAPHRGFLGPSADHKWAQLEKMLPGVSPEVSHRYEDAAVRIFTERLHGDLHRGNILEDSQGEFIMVDFDDMINGPAVQDFWMLMPSSDLSESPEFEILIDAYSELREFPHEQLDLIPLLRGYRIITYAMWIMNRWTDPSFKRLFPDYGSYSYWVEETENLEKIIYLL
jgi:Ser/Thr protein kinase RdoA (MazF antagonist)